MRVDDANRLTSYVESGGNLILLSRNTWQDSSTGDAAWLHMNRILEGVGAPMRIQRNTVVGSVSIEDPPKPPLHITSEAAYPGPLEWTINPAVGYLATEHPLLAEGHASFAAGYVPTLACDSDDIALLATVHKNTILWLHHGPEGGVEFPEAAPPVAALWHAENGDGMVTIIPRSFATLSSYSGTPGDRPILFLELLDRLDENLAAMLNVVITVGQDAETHMPMGCHSGELPLFSATAPTMPALGTGPAQKALHPPVSRPVPETLPIPPLWAESLWALHPQLSNPPPVSPPWFTKNRAHMGYGGLSANQPLQPLLEIGAQHGLDSVVITVEPAFLRNYSPQPVEPPAFANAAQLANQFDLQLFLGAHYRHSHWETLKGVLGMTRGAQQQLLDAPPPLADLWWEEGIRPLVIGAALASIDYPGIDGINIDLELYGAASLWYEDGYAYDAFSLKRIIDELKLFDDKLAVELEGLSHKELHVWLVEKGLLRFAYKTLENAVAKKAEQLRQDALSINPDFGFAFYAPLIPMSWFYRGLMRGFGNKEKPVIMLSYDAAPNRLRNHLQQEGIHIRALSGVLGVLFYPMNFKYAMLNAGARADGYWLFQLSDFPNTDDPEVIKTKNGAPLEYWKKLEEANLALDLLPLK
jgi:hypothetical protein